MSDELFDSSSLVTANGIKDVSISDRDLDLAYLINANACHHRLQLAFSQQSFTPVLLCTDRLQTHLKRPVKGHRCRASLQSVFYNEFYSRDAAYPLRVAR